MRSLYVLALVAVAGGCQTVPKPSQPECSATPEAKQPPWLDFDKEARLVDENALRPALANVWFRPNKAAHGWVGVDGDGSVFCTSIHLHDGELAVNVQRAVRAALERQRYEPAVVLGRPHYSYAPVAVRLWDGSDEDACVAGGGHACWYAATAAADREDHAAEVRWHALACERGMDRSCVALARRYLDGRGVERDRERGLALLEKACADNAYACGYLASALVVPGGYDVQRVYDLNYRACERRSGAGCRAASWNHDVGYGVEAVDLERATALLDESCALNDGTGCSAFAFRLLNGIGVKRDPARARHILERLCAKTDKACDWLGTVVLREQGLAAALPLFRRACEAGDVDACYSLYQWRPFRDVGALDVAELERKMVKHCEEDGTGCQGAADLAGADAARARRFLERGCSNDGIDSCRKLSELLAAEGAAAAAVAAATKSCVQGRTPACAVLRERVSEPELRAILERGCRERGACSELAEHLSAHGEVERALELARAMCARSAHGCHALARIVGSTGEPSTREPQAAALLRQACDRGDGEACVELAQRYRSGTGVTADAAKAAKLEERGCDLDTDFCALPAPAPSP